MYSSSLYHHGVKGMKWGIRRYQNYDGTLTDLGKSRNSTKVGSRPLLTDHKRTIDGDATEVSSKKAPKIDADSLKEAQKTAKVGVDVTKAAVRAIESSERAAAQRYKEEIDLSSMSDQELARRINRMNMERQYKDLMAQSQTSEGKKRAKEILSVAGDVLVSGSTLAGLLLSIQTLLKGGR